jgi:hypothetical protein
MSTRDGTTAEVPYGTLALSAVPVSEDLYPCDDATRDDRS